jgi:hypothetical protein
MTELVFFSLRCFLLLVFDASLALGYEERREKEGEWGGEENFLNDNVCAEV